MDRERCRSGRSGRTRNAVYGQLYRGFESLSLRKRPGGRLGCKHSFATFFIFGVHKFIRSGLKIKVGRMAGRPWWTKPPKTRIPLPCCAGWTKASRLTNCLKTSSFCANPLYAMAAPPQWGTGRRFGRSGNKVRSSEHCMQAEPSCQLLFLVNSLILAFYLLLCLLLSALHFVLLPECRVYFLFIGD